MLGFVPPMFKAFENPVIRSRLKQKQEQTRQTTRTGTEPQRWRSHGGLSIGEWEGERGGKVQRISSIDDRWKIDRGRVRIVKEM